MKDANLIKKATHSVLSLLILRWPVVWFVEIVRPSSERSSPIISTSPVIPIADTSSPLIPLLYTALIPLFLLDPFKLNQHIFVLEPLAILPYLDDLLIQLLNLVEQPSLLLVPLDNLFIQQQPFHLHVDLLIDQQIPRIYRQVVIQVEVGAFLANHLPQRPLWVVRDEFKEGIGAFVKHTHGNLKLVVFLGSVREATKSFRFQWRMGVRELRPVLVEIQDLVSLLSRHLLQILIRMSVYHVLKVRGICREVAELFFVRIYLILQFFFKPGVL